MFKKFSTYICWPVLYIGRTAPKG